MFKTLYKYALGAIALLMCGILPASAQNAVKMTESGGKSTIFMLSQQPKVYISSGFITIETLTDKVECDTADGVTFEFLDYDNAGIEEIGAESPIFKIGNDYLEAWNIKPFSRMEIYDVAGKKLGGATSDANGYVSVSIANLPAGIYIINSTDKNFKFYKK